MTVKFSVTKLDALVRNSGLFQYQIAGSCGIHPTTFSEYIRALKPMKARHIMALAKFFEVEPEDVVGYVEVSHSSSKEESPRER